jgi:PKD repeat protein
MKRFIPVLLFISIEGFSQARTSDLPNSRATPPSGFYINQLTTATASLLNSIIIGGCVQVSNFQVHGQAEAYGVFIDSVDAIGMNGGLLLTTGRANNAIGPDNMNGAGYNTGTVGHSLLTQLAGQPTYNAAWIEFDFTPFADTIFASEFVFGSEEYPEYVKSPYNDVFGFFISGPGISGPYDGAENIALIPNSGIPIAINNVNNGYSGSEPAQGPCDNCQYYVDNSNGPYIQYDAFTTVMSLQYPVIPGETYHFVIAIADAADGFMDSGVFIESESFCGNTWFQYAQFIAQPQGGNTYQFQNQSHRAETYLWDFGDGSLSTDENPVHTYAESGDYEVTLMCSNLCFDTATTVLLNVGTVTDIQEFMVIEAAIQNLSSEAVALDCQLQNSADVSLSMFDISGQICWTERIGISNRFSKTIDASALSPGIYYVRIDAGNSSKTIRFSKM